MKNEVYTPDICAHCGQAENYVIGLDKGSARIVLAMIDAISKKGVNEIHPAREMDTSGKRKWYLTNLSRPRFHGLIAYVDGKKGYYCLTRKAGKFLRGESVPKFAIISKVTRHQEGYWLEEEKRTTIHDLLKEKIMWEGGAERILEMLDPKDGSPKLF